MSFSLAYAVGSWLACSAHTALLITNIFLHCTPMALPLTMAIKIVTHINACLILMLQVQLLHQWFTNNNIIFNSNICQHDADYIPKEVDHSMNLHLPSFWPIN